MPKRLFRSVLLASLLSLGPTLLLLPGCQTPQPGVKTAFGSQFAIVSASVAEATEAATAVLEEMNLLEVTATSTEIDGEITAFTPDRVRIEVYTAREAQGRTEVSVNVGALGDATTGARIIGLIRERLGS